ncbi:MULTISPECIES: hypothetical protein [unclassified Methylobacterium]|uniref:hypothetical protein n=1 Tax=unclassified Methylobacterium TaxID=2615210 RepID=UPI0011C1F7F5|nr:MULTISPECIES: hypothetical protein [unclassified Methylobacterium]QEE39813.1 hypothetical protein FVA80_13490 [Methylobacterium sp. WL1]TXN57343.1 hypothetical protein FV241_11820 [Methylobacterium sp. WL2]
MTTPWKDRTFTNAPPLTLIEDAAALTAEWQAVQAATLTPDQVRAVNRWAHIEAFGEEPQAGEPIDCRRSFPGRVITL